MPETMSPRDAEDLLFYKLKDLILEQSEGEWDDATIVRDAHHFANHLRPLMSPALASSGDQLSGNPGELETGDHAELENAGHIVWWKAGGVSYFPEGESFTLSASCRVETLVTAASALALIAENAALRAQHEAVMAEVAQAGQNLQSQRLALTEAERKLAEAVAVIRDVDQAARRAAAMNDAGYTVTVERTATHIYGLTGTFLSKEAERG